MITSLDITLKLSGLEIRTQADLDKVLRAVASALVTTQGIGDGNHEVRVSDQTGTLDKETTMGTQYVLGPFLPSVTEPGPPATVPGFIAANFDTPATEPGGKVHVKLQPPVQHGDLLPTMIHAFYVEPAAVPQGDAKTAQWFMDQANTYKNGSLPVPQPPADSSGTLTVQVDGVTPGVYYVQIVLEYQTP